ncbi:GPI inositol-deacylase-like isoform X3 [Halichondria panicea]|uniref:GPI inositol-deacylase-like isoform X3 n=1 Tax=Halichondria panicea TaxID=6063 RepID=UPI00312B435A
MSLKYSLVVLLLLLFCGGRLVLEQFYGDQDCEMTWMYQWPQYLAVPLDATVENSYPQYGLFLYAEGDKREDAIDVPQGSLSGVPVLFIPGNAGSHRQARSSASIALRMHSAEFSGAHYFDFFTVKLNEELSGLFGGVLLRQTEYVCVCIRHILSLYSHLSQPPRSVVIIAHSMGGVVARALFTYHGFNASTVHTIIAMASPLSRPVISFDSLLHGFYEREGVVNMSHVTLVSIAGGKRDVMVPTAITPHQGAINLASPAVPRNWVSSDHRAIVWCRRLQLALIRGLFLLQDGRELTRDKTRRDLTLTHLLLRGTEIPLPTTKPAAVLQFKSSQVVMVNATDGWSSLRGGVGAGKYVGVQLSGHAPIHVISNTGQRSWVFLCDQTSNCSDVSSRASLLPPKLGVVKAVSLLPGDWEGKSLLVIAQPTKLHPKSVKKGFLSVHQCIGDDQLPLSLWGTSLTIAQPHCSLMNFSLPGLQEVWESYTAVISSSCGEVVATLSTPWYAHTPITQSHPSHPHNLSVSLSLLVPTPSSHTPHLLIWSPPDCPLTIRVTSDLLESLDKLSVLYTPLLLPWVTAVCIAGSGWSLGIELLAVTTLYGLTSNGWIPYTDWQLLSASRLWGAWTPLLVHLIARAIASLLTHMTRLIAALLHKICCGRETYIMWVWLVMGVPGVMVCSGVGGVCLLVGWLFKASADGQVGLLPVIVCVEVLTVPALGSWVKGLSAQSQLYPDPHLAGMLATVCVALATAWQGAPLHKDRHTGYWEALLAMMLLCYCTVHVYRITGFVLAYMTLRLVELVVAS